MMLTHVHAPCLAIAACALVPAQSVVIPSVAASVSQLPGGYTTLVRSAARTYLLAIEASELADIPIGDVIVGMSFRCGTNTAQPFPNSPTGSLDYTDFTVTIGPCIPPSTITAGGTPPYPPISSVWTGSQTVARTGALSIPNGTFVHAGVSPPPFSEYYFEFQNPAVYTGGDLAILVERSSSNNTVTGTFEGAPNGYRAGAYAFGNSQYQGPDLAYVHTPIIMRLHYGYGVGCPGSGGRIPICVQNADVTGGLGGSILLTATNAPPNTVGLLALGWLRVVQPLGNGCELLVGGYSTVWATFDANGESAINLSLPGGLSLTFNAQYALLDGGAPRGFTVTNGVEPSLN